MLACNYSKHSLSALQVSQVPMVRQPIDGELVVKVHSTSINPADWKTAEGEQAALLSFAWPRVIGFDFSGTVHQVGSDTSTFNIGDPVFGMIQGLPEKDRGTLQEYMVVNEKVCVAKPDNITHAQAAAIPLVGITAVKMCQAAGLVQLALTNATNTTNTTTTTTNTTNETKEDTRGTKHIRVLVTGGAGGVGIHAIQIAKHLFGATFIATTASAGVKSDLCTRMGADLVIDYRKEKFELALATQPKFDAILDCTGEAHKCVPLLAEHGGMCSILAGPTAEALQTWLREGEWPTSKITIGVNSFLHSGCGGSLFQYFAGGSSLKSKCERVGGTFAHVIGTGNGPIMNALSDCLKQNTLEAVIDTEFNLENAIEAIQYQKAGRCAGKVVVNVLVQ